VSRHAHLLVCRSAQLLYGLQLTHVTESMRPQPLCAPDAAAPLALGVSVIRGQAMAIFDLALALGSERAGGEQRFVVLRFDQNPVAVAVEQVVGVRAFEPDALEALPSLLLALPDELIVALGRLDLRLLDVLGAAKRMAPLTGAA
jgi:chemotaxis signal transduction protein